jgi:hypothetical protein
MSTEEGNDLEAAEEEVSLTGHHWTSKSWSSYARLDVTSTFGWIDCDPLEGAANEAFCKKTGTDGTESLMHLQSLLEEQSFPACNDQRKVGGIFHLPPMTLRHYINLDAAFGSTGTQH